MLKELRTTDILLLLISMNLLSMHDPKLDRRITYSRNTKKEEKKYKDVLLSSPSSVPYFKQQSIILQNNDANQYSLIFNRQQPCITQYLLEGNPVAKLIQIDDEINFESNDCIACNFSLQIPYQAGSLTINAQGRFIFEKKIDAYSAYLTCKTVDFRESFFSKNGLIVEADDCKNRAQLTCSDLLFKGKNFEIMPESSLSARSSLTLMAQFLVLNQGIVNCKGESFIQSSLFKNQGTVTSYNMHFDGNEITNLGALVIGDSFHCASKLFDHRGMLDVSHDCIMEKGDTFFSTSSSVWNINGDWRAFINSFFLNGSFNVKNLYAVGKNFTSEKPLHCIAENAHLKIEENVTNAGVIKILGLLDIDSKNIKLEKTSCIMTHNADLKANQAIDNEGAVSVKQHLSAHAHCISNAGKIETNSSDIKADRYYYNKIFSVLSAKNNLTINTPVSFNLLGLTQAQRLMINSVIGLNALGVYAAKNMGVNSLLSVNVGLFLPKFGTFSEIYSPANLWGLGESLFVSYVPFYGVIYAALKSIKGTYYQGKAIVEEIGSLRQQKVIGTSGVIALLCLIKNMLSSVRQTVKLATQSYHLVSNSFQPNNSQVSKVLPDVVQQTVSAIASHYAPSVTTSSMIDWNCGLAIGGNNHSTSLYNHNSNASLYIQNTIDTRYGTNVGILAASDLNVQAIKTYKLGDSSSINGGNVTIDTSSFQGSARNNIFSTKRTRIKTDHLDNQGSIAGVLTLEFTGDLSRFKGIGTVEDLQYYGTLENNLADTFAKGKSDLVNITQSGSVTLFAGDQNVHLEDEHTMNHALKIESFGAVKCDKKLTSSKFVDLKAKGSLEHKSIVAGGKVSLGGKNIIATPNVTRTGDGTNYEDYVEDITITGTGIEAYADEHVIYEAVKTHSGKGGTTMTAGGKNISAAVIAEKHTESQTVNQKTSETEVVKDTFRTAYVCEYTSEGHVTMLADDTIELYGSTFNSRGAAPVVNGKNGVRGYVVEDIHQHESEYKKEGGWLRSNVNNIIKSVSTTAKTVDFKGGKIPEISSDIQIFLPFMSDSSHIKLNAPLVENPVAKNITSFYSKNDWSNVVWESKKSRMQEDITYSPSFTGIIETNAEKIYCEEVKGHVLPIYKTMNNDTYCTRNILEEIHAHQKHSFQRPTRAASLVIAMAVTMATAGIGASAGATIVATIGCKSAVSVAIVTNVTSAAVTSLSVQATDALLKCNGDFVAAAKTIASTNTLKNIVLSAGTAGVMVGAGQALNEIGLPAVKDAHNLSERFMYAAPRQVVNASIKTVANVIAGQEFKNAAVQNLRSALAGTIGVACTSQIGDAYAREQIDPISHKLLHTGVGAVEGAILDGFNGAMVGGMSALVTETVADVLAPEIPSFDCIKSLELQLGRPLTQEEFTQAWNDQISNYWQEVSSTADISRFAAVSITLLTRQDVDIANAVSATAIDNNFLVLAGYGLITASVAHSAYEINNAYKEGGAKAALKQLGVEVVTQVACTTAGKVAFKVGCTMYPTAKAAVTSVLESTPGLKVVLGELADAIVVAGEKIGQSALGKGVAAVEGRLVNATDKITQKLGNFGANLAEDLVDCVVPNSVISKMEAQTGKQIVENTETTLVQTLGNLSKPDLVMTTPEGVKISVPDTSEAGLLQQSMDQVSDIAKNNISDALKDKYYEVNGFKFTQVYYDRLWDKGRACPGFRAESVLRDVRTIVIDPEGYEGFFKYISNDWEMIFNPSTRVVAHLSPISSASKKLI